MRLRSKEINVFNMSALDLFASALGAFILITLVLFPYFPNTGDSQERVDEVKAQLAEAESRLEQTGSELERTSSELEQSNAELAQLRAQQKPGLEQELQILREQLSACQAQREETQAALNACQAQLQEAEAADSALGACEDRNRQMQQELQSCAQQLRKKFVLVVISWSTNDDIDLHIIDPAGREYYYEKNSIQVPAPNWKRTIPAARATRSGCTRPRNLAGTGCTSSITAVPAGMYGCGARY